MVCSFVQCLVGRPLQVAWNLDEPILPAFNAPVVVGGGTLQVVAVRGRGVYVAFLKPQDHLARQVGDLRRGT